MDLSRLLGSMARDLESVASDAESLEAINGYARTAIGGDDAGVLLRGPRRMRTAAATSDAVEQVHAAQVDLDEGPCLAALDGGDHTYLVTDTSTDERWPRWAGAAVAAGYRSVVSSSLESRGRRIGSLNVYARRPGAFGVADAEVLDLLAVHAAIALGAARARQQLTHALETRGTIGRAQGVLMRAFDLDEDQAFAVLKRLSQDQNLKLLTVAEAVVKHRGLDPGSVVGQS